MDGKERDKWDEAVRSRLKDFEVDTSPGDWEAIVDRLPGVAPIPLRRKWYYGIAAVLIFLVLSGGIYFYHTEPELIPVARDRSSVRESVPEEMPLVKESLMKEPQLQKSTPLLAVVRERKRQETVSSAPVENVEKASRPLLKRREPEETSASPGDSVRQIKAYQVEKKQPATPLASVREDRKKASRKWGFGMGGGALSMGANNLVPQYVTNSTMLRSESLERLIALDGEKAIPAETDIHHKTPICLGISVSRYLNERFPLQMGLTYSYLRSEWSTNNTYHVDNDQRLHFLVIPLSLTYRIAEWNRLLFYVSAGGMAEINVAGKRRMTLYSEDVEIVEQSEHMRMKKWLWSVNARGGISYPLFWIVGAFAEVGASYYFDNGSEIETIHSEKPFNVSLSFGFCLGFLRKGWKMYESII